MHKHLLEKTCISVYNGSASQKHLMTIFLTQTHAASGQFTVETVSYFVSEGPGSLLKNGGSSLE